ncbi:esterase YqiA [Veronia nyctiphanis]|uniref:Esterase YqiA n=1 Tax=Veronia nyctiphanis TaxID=1278244 RepID=A0A4Q0YIL5_9GAMM|nr:esterase YqiA [Veronia nyctiphanis]RXJ70540.1 esterase YqiA [Veronia nyctiphanis]
MKSLLVYIHGFNSSPKSHKAQQTLAWCQQERPDIQVVVPKLASYPEPAAKQLLTLIETYQDTHHIGLVGSSLGGYLATWLHNRFGCPAVVVNPAAKPYDLLTDFLGPQKNPYSGEEYVLEPQHMVQLRALDSVTIKDPSSIWLLQQEGDEVLDFREAVAKYKDCRQTVEPDGDHSFVGFERYCANIVQFLGL